MTKVALQRVLVRTSYTNFASSQAVHKSLALKQQIPRWTARPSRKCQFKQRKIVIEGMVLSTRALAVDGICPRCHSSWVRMANGMSALSEVTTVNLRLFPPIREMNDALALGTTETFAKQKYVLVCSTNPTGTDAQDFKGSRKNLLIRSIDELIGTGLGISQMPQE